MYLLLKRKMAHANGGTPIIFAPSGVSQIFTDAAP